MVLILFLILFCKDNNIYITNNLVRMTEVAVSLCRVTNLGALVKLLIVYAYDDVLYPCALIYNELRSFLSLLLFIVYLNEVAVIRHYIKIKTKPNMAVQAWFKVAICS